MYKKITNNNEITNVLRVRDDAQIPLDESNSDYDACLKWLDKNNLTLEQLEEAYPKSEQDYIRLYSDAMQVHIDATAHSKDYKDGVSCASYSVSTNVGWKAESLAFIAWRDSCWRYAYQVLDNAQSGTQLPSLQDFIDNCPVITWP